MYLSTFQQLLNNFGALRYTLLFQPCTLFPDTKNLTNGFSLNNLEFLLSASLTILAERQLRDVFLPCSNF